MEKTGFIYILTNPSFPQYVKIGYAKAHEVCFSVCMLRLLWLALNGSAATKGTIIKYAAERER